MVRVLAGVSRTWKFPMIVLLLNVVLYQQEVFAARRFNVQKRVATMVDHFKTSAGKRALNAGAVPSPRQILGLQADEDLNEARRFKTTTGSIRIKYVETYRGIPVEGEGVVLTTDENGAWSGEANGELVEGIRKDVPSTTPELSIKQALVEALRIPQLDPEDVIFNENTDAKLVIFVQHTRKSRYAVTTRLTYKLSYRTFSVTGLSRPFVIIDAITGDTLACWEGITTRPRFDDLLLTPTFRADIANNVASLSMQGSKQRPVGSLVYINGDGGNVKRGRHTYGEEYEKLLVTKANNRCYLTNEQVEVRGFSLCNYTDKSLTKWPHQFSCYLGNHDFVNGAFSPSNDAFFYSLQAHNMFTKWYNTSALKFKIKVLVHDADYYNAYWDGQFLILLDGGDLYFPQTEADVVGHELGHGFTEHNSDLIYSSQSGGINEAFSDMAGEALEYYVDNKTDFLVGGGDSKYDDKPLRYMRDPTMDGRSIASFDDYCEGINVHYSSGIFNRAFYLLVKEKGWDVRQAFQVFVLANQMYWRASSGFHDGACGVKNAAKDLGLKEEDVYDVFRKVGVIPCLGGPNVEIGGFGDLKVEGRGAQNFVWYAVEGMKDVRISLTGGSGAAHMIVKHGSRHDSNKREIVSVNEGNDQMVEFPNPKEGNYYISVYTKTGYKDARIDLSYDYSGLKKNLSDSMLLKTICRYYGVYRNKHYTSIARVYSLKSLNMRDFLEVEAKQASIKLYEGKYTGTFARDKMVGYGYDKVRVCRVTAEQYYVVVREWVATKKDDRIDCKKIPSDLRLAVASALSGTKLKRDNKKSC